MAKGRLASYKTIRKLDGTVALNEKAAAELQAKAAAEAAARKEMLMRPTTPGIGKTLTTAEVRQRIMVCMHDNDYDPIKELIEMVQATNDKGEYVHDAKLRKEIHMELAQFVAPKLKSTDHHVEGSMSINVVVQKFGPVTPGDNAKSVEPLHT